MAAIAGSLFWVAMAVTAFHAAYAFRDASFLILLYLFALLQLARARQWRLAFYPGLAVGLLIAAFRLAFFWRLFGAAALALWLVYAFWIGLFVAVARLCLTRLGGKWGWLLIPFIWTGLEYFRSELYYLRFSWLSAGYAFSGSPWQGLLGVVGVYGIGFVLTGLAAGAASLWENSKLRSVVGLAIGMACFCMAGPWVGAGRPTPPAASVRIAGVQMEFPSETEVELRLDDLIRAHPDAELFVLSEYTFDGPVPSSILDWCREYKRYLIAGGKDPAAGEAFYNTAFVVGPDGDIVFRQVKAVPIQFFKDGMPAPEQSVWNSPWGKLGICICYDLSYTRVTDRLVALGAEALIVPTMDISDWGMQQHELHARIAPARAAEYGIPIFRVASSGISQLANCTGHVAASAPRPGDGAMLAGAMELRGPGRRPLDRWLAPFAVGVTVLSVLWTCRRRKAK